MQTRRQAITWTNVDPVYGHIYAALGEDELIKEKKHHIPKLPPGHGNILNPTNTPI